DSAATALGNQSTLPDSTLQVLIGTLKDKNKYFRRAAASALGKQSTLPGSALQALIGALQNEDSNLRDLAASALGNQSTLPGSVLQAIIGVLKAKSDSSFLLGILEKHAKSTFMAIPGLLSSSMVMLYRAFLVHYSSQNSASLWVRDSQVFFYTDEGFGRIDGLRVEDVEKLVAVFDA
ncbi:hypothetical protein BGZ46_004763, partial [Entomortierella lignicola]